MKSEIIKILANAEGKKEKQLYNELFIAYAKEATVREAYHYNTGYTPQKMESLVYEIKKMYGITDKDVALARLSGENAKSVGESLQAEGSEAGQPNNPTAELPHNDLILKQIPDDAKQGLKLREEYPFLNDANCPDALKILVADKISAYKNYAGMHAAALDAATEAEAEDKLYEYAKEAMKQWNINADIKAELDFYRDSEGRVLGNVDQVADMKMEQWVKEMSEVELLKLRTNAQKSVSKYKDNPEMYDKWKTKLEMAEARLQKVFGYSFEK